MPSQCFISIVIPAYNEEERLQKSLPPVKEYLSRQNFTWEVVLVDDGSNDATCEIPKMFFNEGEARVVRNPGNKGKGYSVRQGVLAARGEIVLISDADFSTPITEWKKLYAILEQGYDIVIGSRGLKDANVTIHQAWYREKIGRTFSFLVQLIVFDGFMDTQCGFKCFRREAVLPIFRKMVIDHFSFDVELLFIAKRRGLKIKEVSVEWKNVLFSRVRIFRDSLRMLYDLFKIKINAAKGLYD